MDDIIAASRHLISNQVRALDSQPKIGAHGKPVMFFHPKDFNGVLVTCLLFKLTLFRWNWNKSNYKPSTCSMTVCGDTLSKGVLASTI